MFVTTRPEVKLKLPRTLAAALAFGLCGSAALAQTSPPADAQQARIEALERELNRVEAKLDTLTAALAASNANAQTGRATPGTSGAAQAIYGSASTTASAPSGSNATPTSAGSTINPGAPSTAVAQGAGDAARLFSSGTPTSAATASILAGRPAIQSTDGQFTASILGVMQFDTAAYDQRAPGLLATDLRRGAGPADSAHARELSSGTDFRRARIGLAGKVFGDFEYDILYEYGGAGEEDAGHVQELWFQYSGLKPFHARVGAFPPFIGLEDAGSTNGMPFLERPASSDIARSLAGGDYREAGEIVANTDRWFVSAAVTSRLVGVVNSTATGVSQPYDSQLGWVGRAAFVPFRGKDYLVHLGLHGSYVEHPADAGGPDASATTARDALELRERPELRVDGTRLIDTGAIDSKHGYTAGGEFAAQWRSLFLQGEYENVGIERRNSTLSNPTFPGWYVEGTWILTGESRKYNTGNFAFDGPPVKHTFSLADGGWGAFELGLRYSDMNLNYHQGSARFAPPADGVRGGEQQILTAGLNWYLNPVIRLMFDYQHVRIDRLSPNAVTFQTFPGASIGQAYNAYTVRSQLAF